MKFLIIIPAHNEEDNILFCLESLKNQTFQDFKIVLVNDGSTDKTKEIAESFKTKFIDFQLINLPKSKHQPGAKVVHAFNEGLRFQDLNDFEIICKIDADIVFPSHYFSQLYQVFEHDKKIGIASGILKINPSQEKKKDVFHFGNEKGSWQFENISSKNHVRGPVKAYRKSCFQEMNGLKPVLGWDNIDVMLAKINGWKVETKKDVWVKHLRPTAEKYQKEKAKKQGEYFYNIGLNFPLASLSALKFALRNRSFLSFFQIMTSFQSQSHKSVLTNEEIKSIRKLRWRELSQKIKQ